MTRRDAEDRRRIVTATKDYYDGPADEIYRNIWGENVHIGYFEEPAREDLPTAMQRSNERMCDGVDLGPATYVLDVGCGYGAMARFLARRFACPVTATNISERELEWGRELTRKQGLDDLVQFQYADFHELPFEDRDFDVYWSQEAFLHAADKQLVIDEAARVLNDDGVIVLTDLLVRQGTPQDTRERIYQRVNSPDMWDTSDYREAFANAGLDLETHQDWSDNVAPTYAWVRDQLEQRRDEFEAKIGKEVVDRTSQALQFWVDCAEAGQIGWEYFVARKRD
jgi:sarcosine/dimethylglycine N-methyltransferase